MSRMLRDRIERLEHQAGARDQLKVLLQRPGENAQAFGQRQADAAQDADLVVAVLRLSEGWGQD